MCCSQPEEESLCFSSSSNLVPMSWGERADGLLVVLP